jgi:beta-glucosidase
MRMSDLLAFEIALERGNPGSVMCSYNKVNGDHSCENAFLLSQVLRKDWGFKGYVMSDWGGAHSTAKAANAGLDQDSGFPFDDQPYFGKPLADAVASGAVSPARLDQMAGRILRSLFAVGVYDNPVAPGPIDIAAHREVSRRDAEAGAVLLRNVGAVLPLSGATKHIVVIGGHADKGVLSGGGSSQVYPGDGQDGGNAVPGLTPTSWPGPVVYFPSSPLAELRKAMPGTQIDFADGKDRAKAVALAKQADVVIVFATQWAGESFDVPLTLSDDQDGLIDAVSQVNPRTVVVLQTGGAALLPWADRTAAILEAWYPGSAGGTAIANLLTGKTNPSGHLPMTFPMALDQLPHPEEPHAGDAVYTEGATVGYKWFDAKSLTPRYPFGHGLSYTTFSTSGLTVRPNGAGLVASVTIKNTGMRSGADVVQIYVEGSGWEAPRRLGGFKRVMLAPGQSSRVEIPVDPRLLAVWRDGWRINPGSYRIYAAQSSRELGQPVSVKLAARTLPGR